MASIERHVTREVIGLDASSSCREAARLMAEKRIGAVAVKAGGTTIGLVTERDLVYDVLASGLTCDHPIAKAMRGDLPFIAPGASESDCANLMQVHFTRHLLVGEKGAVVGIISMQDVIRLMLDEKQWLIDELQIYISGR
jgi:CBS domain-containing protein